MHTMPKVWMSAWRVKAMSTNSERIVRANSAYSQRAWPLHTVEHARKLENLYASQPGTIPLMQTAGLALARLTLALAPHAKVIWIACGPGNNGGDGMEAAVHLLQWGKQPVVSLVHDPFKGPADARRAWEVARQAGVTMQSTVPPQFDICLDALFGIGAQRPIAAPYADWVEHMNASASPTIAVDIPSGLHADHGSTQNVHVVADFTLSLLTLKPGLFTASGRDACGEIWFNDLGVAEVASPQAILSGPPPVIHRPHASNKGGYGDVAVVGGAQGMTGAALLAARSALHGGAGRIYVCMLDEHAAALDIQYPELMFRPMDGLNWFAMTVVAGCGGGGAISAPLPQLLREARALVLDADALNQIAQSPDLQALVHRRQADCTVMTPHPLEAARLLGIGTDAVQSDRLGAASQLAERFQSVVVLKGSGTIIAAPHSVPHINPTGNAKLATAGTGDVLAGLTGSYLAQGLDAMEAACAAGYRHGLAADHWQRTVLHASDLCQRL
jgi:hydroxyethylthiazole kinase-like uncharacterized protein yjeF